MRDRQNLILGAGLSGMTAAYNFKLSDADEWRVFERNERVGGLARSIKKQGYSFDYGPHILFTIIDRIEVLIRDLLGDNFHAQERQAFIYHKKFDHYTEFPFQAHMAGLPYEVVRDCLVGLVEAVERQARGQFHPTNYETWMRGFFGDGIADHFLMEYSRKMWTVEPESLGYDWIAGRVPTPDYQRIIAGALTTEIEKIGVHSNFWYPKVGGVEELPKSLGQRLDNVELNKEIARIELPERQVVFTDGEIVPFRRLILTSPICFLDQLIPNLSVEMRQAVANLNYIGTCVVNLGIKRPDITDKHWVYFYEDIFPFNRLSFPGQFSPSCVPEGCSSVSTENSYSKWRPLNREKSVQDTISSLQAAHIIEAEDEVEVISVEEIYPSYVMFDPDHAKNVAIIREGLKEHGIYTAGRFGEWAYFNMDHAMRSGVRVSEEILEIDGRKGALANAL